MASLTRNSEPARLMILLHSRQWPKRYRLLLWHIPDWGLISAKQMDKNAKFSAYTLEDANGKVNVAHANPSNQFIVVRKGYEHPELAVKIVNLFYDKLANDKNAASLMPESCQVSGDGRRRFNETVQYRSQFGYIAAG